MEPVHRPRARHLPAALTLAVRYRSPDDLVVDPKNPRQHSPRQVEQIARSISAFGFNAPILVNHASRVVAGHGRLAAAIQLGMGSVPTITLEHLTPSQIKAFAIADNRLAELATWDDQRLGELFAELTTVDLDFDLSATGFEAPEIDFRIQSLSGLPAGSDPADDVLDVGPAVCRLGDVWILGDHRIACGSALDARVYQQLMGDERAAIVFSDPPFNLRIAGNVGGKGKIKHREFVQASGEMSSREYTDFLSSAFGRAADVSVDGALHYICQDWRHVPELLDAAARVYSTTMNCCVWNKGSGGMGSLYRSQHEFVYVFKVGTGKHQNHVELGRHGRNRTNVWDYPGINSFARATDEGNLLALHPTVKPVALVADAIMDTSTRGDVVLDMFLGSGTTIVAAERVGRRGRGIELDALYVDVAIRRWQRLTKRPANHATLKCTFDELADVRLEVACG